MFFFFKSRKPVLRRIFYQALYWFLNTKTVKITGRQIMKKGKPLL
jgi:hypothetical protein